MLSSWNKIEFYSSRKWQRCTVSPMKLSSAAELVEKSNKLTNNKIFSVDFGVSGATVYSLMDADRNLLLWCFCGFAVIIVCLLRPTRLQQQRRRHKGAMSKLVWGTSFALESQTATPPSLQQWAKDGFLRTTRFAQPPPLKCFYFYCSDWQHCGVSLFFFLNQCYFFFSPTSSKVDVPRLLCFYCYLRTPFNANLFS